jgi:hypothetical protein
VEYAVAPGFCQIDHDHNNGTPDTIVSMMAAGLAIGHSGVTDSDCLPDGTWRHTMALSRGVPEAGSWSPADGWVAGGATGDLACQWCMHDTRTPDTIATTSRAWVNAGNPPWAPSMTYLSKPIYMIVSVNIIYFESICHV